MRSLLRYGLVAVGTLALLTIGFVTFRARLEPKAGAQTIRNGSQAGNAVQVAGCDTSAAPSLPTAGVPGSGNPCLVISSFRENGPWGTQDEFVEIFNASSVAVTISSLSRDPAGSALGIGVFVSAGQGFHPKYGQAANVSVLACNIPGAVVIPGRRWYLCGGSNTKVINGVTVATKGYSLDPWPAAGGPDSLGINSGVAHSFPDQKIGTVPAGTNPGIDDIPDDAGIALLAVGTNIVTPCKIDSLGCPSGFNFPDVGGGGTGSAIVLDKVGFNPYSSGSPINTGPGLYPANIYPSLAAQYCEGTLIPSPAGGPTNVAKNLGCLEPVGDASTTLLTAGADCPTVAGVPGFNVRAFNPLYPIGAEPNNPGPIAAGPPYDTIYPLVDNGFFLRADGGNTSVKKCYGQSGQYKIERRRAGGQFADPSGELHKDSYNSSAQNNPVAPSLQAVDGACAQTGPQAAQPSFICGNNDDFIMDAPNPATNNVGVTETGIARVSSVLGNAWPHSSAAPPIVGTGLVAQAPFDICASVATANDGKAVIPCTLNQLGPRNSERRYSQDPNIWGTENDPFGTFILRYRYTPSVAVQGIRWRIDDLSTLCGGQTRTTTIINNPPLPPGTPQATSGVGTQEARNLRGPDFSTSPAQTPVPSCQGEGSDFAIPANFFTAILKGVNHYGEIVVDSSGTAQAVAGSVLEDVFLPPSPTPVTGSLQPYGGGSNSTFVVNTLTTTSATLNMAPLGPAAILRIGDGVSGGTGNFNRAIAAGFPFRIAFKFGVVRSGRFKILLGREAFLTGNVAP